MMHGESSDRRPANESIEANTSRDERDVESDTDIDLAVEIDPESEAMRNVDESVERA